MFWASRDGLEEIAAIGCADVVTGIGPARIGDVSKEIAATLHGPAIDARMYGGMRFDPASEVDAVWRSFGSYRFVLPQIELRTVEGRSRLIVNVTESQMATDPQPVLRAIRDVDVACPASSMPRISVAARENVPGRGEWLRAVGWLLAAFSRTPLAKVVLARLVRFALERPVPPSELLRALREVTPGCYHFLIEPEDGVAFVGASPERLLRREDREIWSEAVAGTRARGESAHADLELKKELLLSEKDQREHEYVRQSIKEALSEVTSVLRVDTRASVMRLERGWHLVSRVEGTLRKNVETLTLLNLLHPTPAVGGYPHDDAMEAIAVLEPFDRGWYAGPVGWIGRRSAEFAVAIRSGLLKGDYLNVYSGAGIVGGSDPAKEWAEIEQKIADFLQVLRHDNQHSE
jgi:menaquinone-specific isochorismate synthase